MGFKVRIDKREEFSQVSDGRDPLLDLDRIPEYGGWDPDDPGLGQAVLLDDGREVLNPVPMEPPVGFKEEPSMMQMMEAMIKRHLAGLNGEDELDSVEDAIDFDVPDDVDPTSPYDVEMMDEFPSMPRSEEDVPVAEPLDEEEAIAPPPKRQKPPKKAAPVKDDEEEGA